MSISNGTLYVNPHPSYDSGFSAIANPTPYQRVRVWLTGSKSPMPLHKVRSTLLHCWSEINIRRVYEAISGEEPIDSVNVSETGDLPRLDAPTVCLTTAILGTLLEAKKKFPTCTSVVVELYEGTGERSNIASVIEALPHIMCIRIRVSSAKDAQLGCDLMKKPPPFLKGLEFVSASDPSASLPLEGWNTLLDFLCSNSVQIPLVRVRGEPPKGFHVNKVSRATKKNQGCFHVEPEEGDDESTFPLEKYAVEQLMLRALDIEVEWEKVSLVERIGTTNRFGLSVMKNFTMMVPCDFDSLAAHSDLPLVAEMKERGSREIIEPCCGPEIGPFPVAFQLVAFYLSAKVRDGSAYAFVSREAFEEVRISEPSEEARKEQNRTELRMTVFDRAFVSLAQEKGGSDRPLLWSELMSIASYLALPTLERLIRTVVVLDEKNQFRWYDDDNHKKRKRE